VLLPSGSGYFTCKQNMKSVASKFKLGGIHEKHVVATRNLNYDIIIKSINTLMYTVWHVDKYKITFKLFINHWTNEML
jgi:hypothetical protein